MTERYEQSNAVWVRMRNPDADEIHEIMHEFSLAPAVVDDLSVIVPRTSVALCDDAIKLVMRFPVVKRTDIDRPHEIKFIISKRALITVQYEDIEAIDRFRKELDVVTTLKKASSKLTGADLFISLISELYESAETKLDYVESLLTTAEREIFNEREKEMVFELSRIGKKLITFRQAHREHGYLVATTKEYVAKVFTKKTAERLTDIEARHTHILQRITGLFETLHDLRETNFAILTTKQNEIMKILTILAFITFPLTLMTSMFGMNTETTPIVGQTGDFWIILGIMTVATICFFAFFKYKRWM